MANRHRISAGAIVVHEARVLMVRCRKLGAYDFRGCPCGGMKEAETLEAAAAREVMEETGLTVEIGQLAYIEELFNPDTRFIKFWFLAHFEGGALDTSQPEALDEYVVQAAWRTPEEAMTGSVLSLYMQQRFLKTWRRACRRRCVFPCAEWISGEPPTPGPT